MKIAELRGFKTPSSTGFNSLIVSYVVEGIERDLGLFPSKPIPVPPSMEDEARRMTSRNFGEVVSGKKPLERQATPIPKGGKK